MGGKTGIFLLVVVVLVQSVLSQKKNEAGPKPKAAQKPIPKLIVGGHVQKGKPVPAAHTRKQLIASRAQSIVKQLQMPQASAAQQAQQAPPPPARRMNPLMRLMMFRLIREGEIENPILLYHIMKQVMG